MTRQPPELAADHPLRRLDGRPLAGGRLRLFPGPTSRFGALYFSLHLERDGSLSSEPVLVALHHSGRYPSYNWIEVAQLNDEITFEAGDSGPPLSLGAAGLHRLMALLGQLIPPGGHLMTEYESPRWTSTARALNLGAPPAATELGDLLKAAGCAASIRNWHIAEGGREGPRKLQGFKPLDEGRARAARQARDQELREFLAAPDSGTQPDSLVDARRRARRLLRPSTA
jgi:hypothetical protein